MGVIAFVKASSWKFKTNIYIWTFNTRQLGFVISVTREKLITKIEISINKQKMREATAYLTAKLHFLVMYEFLELEFISYYTVYKNYIRGARWSIH